MKKHRTPKATHYTLMHELCASATEPLPEAGRRWQLTRMWNGLAQLETCPKPNGEDLSVCADAVNLMVTLVKQGHIDDASGLLQDANAALVQAVLLHDAGRPIRLSAPGIQAVRAVLEDYAEVKAVLPARTMIRCHRLTERASLDLAAAKHRQHGVRVMLT